MPNDRALVDDCLRGDPGAWDRFVATHYRFALFLIQNACARFRVLYTQQDCEDVCQEVFLDLVKNDFRRLRAYDPDQPFGAYLRVICRSKVVDFARRRGRLPNPLPPDLETLPEVAPSEDRTDLVERIERAIGDLSPRDQLMAKLYFYKGASYQEIAQALGVETNSVGPLLARLVERIRKRAHS